MDLSIYVVTLYEIVTRGVISARVESGFARFARNETFWRFSNTLDLRVVLKKDSSWLFPLKFQLSIRVARVLSNLLSRLLISSKALYEIELSTFLLL